MSRLNDIALLALDHAKYLGADSAEVSGGVSRGFSAHVHMGEVDTVEYDNGKELSITVMIGQKRGSASTNDFSENSIKAATKAAYEFANYAAEDKFLTLPERDQLAFDVNPPSIHFPWKISVQDAIELAKSCEAQALNYDKRIVKTDGATVSSHESDLVIANSLGFMNSYASSSHDISCMPIASVGADMQRDYDYSVAHDPKDLWKIETIASSAAKKTLNRLGAKTVASCKVPVIFSDHAAASLLGCVVGAASGASIYKKSSFLVDKIGQEIFPPHISLLEKPDLVKGMGSSPFDNDGVKTREKYLIQNGILETYLLSTYSANQLKQKTTGNAGGVFNLLVQSEDAPSKADLIKQMGKGIIVTEMMGQGVNMVTGDFSKGITGFWVENGEIQFPIHEMTVAGNLLDMYRNIVAIADDVDLRRSIRTGSILVEGLTVAG